MGRLARDIPGVPDPRRRPWQDGRELRQEDLVDDPPELGLSQGTALSQAHDLRETPGAKVIPNGHILKQRGSGRIPGWGRDLLDLVITANHVDCLTDVGDLGRPLRIDRLDRMLAPVGCPLRLLDLVPKRLQQTDLALDDQLGLFRDLGESIGLHEPIPAAQGFHRLASLAGIGFRRGLGLRRRLLPSGEIRLEQSHTQDDQRAQDSDGRTPNSGIMPMSTRIALRCSPAGAILGRTTTTALARAHNPPPLRTGFPPPNRNSIPLGPAPSTSGMVH